jgi:hypothetical protein
MYLRPSTRRPNLRGCGCRGLGVLPASSTLHTNYMRAIRRPIVAPVRRPIATPQPPVNRGSGWNWWNQQTNSGNTNTTGVPSTILSYDAYGNPVYSVPPPGGVITGRDAAGNPLYNGASSGSVPLQTSTNLLSNQIVGYDNYGNPIYAGSAAAAGLLAQQSAAAAAATPAADATSSSSYQSILDWFSESTLVNGLANWEIVAGLGAVYLFIQTRRGR